MNEWMDELKVGLDTVMHSTVYVSCAAHVSRLLLAVSLVGDRGTADCLFKSGLSLEARDRAMRRQHKICINYSSVRCTCVCMCVRVCVGTCVCLGG